MTWLDSVGQKSKVTAGHRGYEGIHPSRRWGVEIHLVVRYVYDIYEN